MRRVGFGLFHIISVKVIFLYELATLNLGHLKLDVRHCANNLMISQSFQHSFTSTYGYNGAHNTIDSI